MRAKEVVTRPRVFPHGASLEGGSFVRRRLLGLSISTKSLPVGRPKNGSSRLLARGIGLKILNEVTAGCTNAEENTRFDEGEITSLQRPDCYPFIGASAENE